MQLWHIIVLSFIAEIIEVLWQYAPTMGAVIYRVWRLYKHSIFWLLIAHTGYLYLLYISLYYDLLNWPIIVAIAFKTLDIFTKIEMVRKVYIAKEVDPITKEMMSMKFSPIFWLIGPLTYPYLIWLAFTQINV